MRRWVRGAVMLVSLLAAAPPVPGAECQPITDLAGARLGEFPRDWKPRAEQAREVYRVLEEGGLRFIRATAEGTGVQMGKEFAWDLKTHPVLAWRWRPRAFPAGADEREGARNDSALGVYTVFPHTPMSVKTIKYVWSLVAPVGTTASASAGLTRMLVVRSGPPADDGWVDEAVDIPHDYQRLFEEAPGRPRGIAILTDADQTKSRAVGDYTAFRICPAGAP